MAASTKFTMTMVFPGGQLAAPSNCSLSHLILLTFFVCLSLHHGLGRSIHPRLKSDKAHPHLEWVRSVPKSYDNTSNTQLAVTSRRTSRSTRNGIKPQIYMVYARSCSAQSSAEIFGPCTRHSCVPCRAGLRKTNHCSGSEFAGAYWVCWIRSALSSR